MADCTYSVPDLDVSGDMLYGGRICNQAFIDWAWQTHGFNGTYWQGGWGFDDVCNVRKPLARCMNAIWMLNYSAEDYNNEAWNTDALHWGGRYVREQFKRYDDLRAMCGDGTATAVTTGCQQARQWNDWRCTQGYNETKRACRSWFFLFAWICHLWAEVTRFVCTVWDGSPKPAAHCGTERSAAVRTSRLRSGSSIHSTEVAMPTSPRAPAP